MHHPIIYLPFRQNQPLISHRFSFTFLSLYWTITLTHPCHHALSASLLHIGNHHLHPPLTLLTLLSLHPPPAPLHLSLPPSCSSVNSAHSSASRSSGGGGSGGIGGSGGGSQPHSPTSSSSSSYRYRSSLPHQPPPPGGIAAHRLSSVSSHDSGFVSQDANIYSKPPSPMPSDITSQVQLPDALTEIHTLGILVMSLKTLVSCRATELV